MPEHKNYTFYDRAEYFEQLTEAVDALDATQPGARVAIATMEYGSEEPLVGKLIRRLGAAAERGVPVYLSVDAYAFLVNERTHIPGPLWHNPTLNQRMRKPFSGRLESLEALHNAGGHYSVLNMPTKRFSIIPAGRSHFKGAVINDDVYVGGCNLSVTEQLDVMVRWRSKHAADVLYGTLVDMVNAGNTHDVFGTKDRRIHLDDDKLLLMDAGVPNQSGILDEAFERIDGAEEWIFYTSQYPPGGKTAMRLLNATKRGVNVRTLYSHPTAHGSQALGYQAYKLLQRTLFPAELFAGELPAGIPRLHAKVLATEKGTLWGSHNYIAQGVQFGTAEIAVCYDDPEFAQGLIRHIDQLVSRYTRVN